MELGKALTWNDIADMYDDMHRGKPARTLDMNYVFVWASNQENVYYDEISDTLFLITEDE